MGESKEKFLWFFLFKERTMLLLVFALTQWRGLRYARGQEEYEKPEVSHACCRRFF
jgi:hypothetical protein